MANTWRGNSAAFPTLNFDENNTLRYEVHRIGDRLEFSFSRTAKEKVADTVRAPVQAMVGGKRSRNQFPDWARSGLTASLARAPALIEARYALSRTAGALVLLPGFSKEQPSDHEDELGRVLSPTFELRCLTCHGKPDTLGRRQIRRCAVRELSWTRLRAHRLRHSSSPATRQTAEASGCQTASKSVPNAIAD